MKRLTMTILALVLAVTASAAELTETIERTFDVRTGATLRLSNINGAVTVGSWDQPRIRVVAVKRVKGDRDEAQKFLRELQVEMSPRDGGLSVRTVDPRQNRGVNNVLDWIFGDDVSGQVKYDVTVPRSMNVEVSNTNGTIQLSDVTGKHDLETTNGRISVIRCAGALEAETTNGAIDAELLKVTKGQPLRFETTNGRIRVEVPRDIAVDLDADTTNGAITTDLPVTTRSTDRNSLSGTINGGGTPLRARTTNGAIEIRTR